MQFREIIKVLQEAGMTIVISSHVLSDLAELCTSVGIMELGFLVESAPLKELYRRLSRQQIFLSTLGKLEALIAQLKNHPLFEDGRCAGTRASTSLFYRESGKSVLSYCDRS
jgi:ABC-2 type transport system ATP-binding protein